MNRRFFRSHTFFTILLTLLIVCIIGACRDVFEHNEIINFGAEQHFWVLKANHHQKHHLIAIGDSRVNRGLSPSAIDSILPGMDSYNFAFESGGLNKEIFKAAQKLLVEREPRVILMGITPFALLPQNQNNEQYRKEHYHANSDAFQFTYDNLFLFPFAPLKFKDKQFNTIQQFHKNGWVACDRFPRDSAHELNIYRGIFKNSKPDPVIIAGIISQTQEWHQQGIEVFAFRPPTITAMRNLEDSLSNFNYSSFIEQFEVAGGKWINVDPKEYESFDGSHVTMESAKKLSAEIAENIKHTERSITKISKSLN